MLPGIIFDETPKQVSVDHQKLMLCLISSTCHLFETRMKVLLIRILSSSRRLGPK
jgi:hypothetical protein